MPINAESQHWLADNGFADDINSIGKYQDTPILLASRRGLLTIVKDLLANGANPNHRNMDGTNALWAAVVADSYAIADLLLAHGVDIDNQNDNGASALMYASSAGKTSWVKYLIERGANTALTSLDDYSALDLAGNRECLRLLRATACV